jgi:predicted PurR-regulated permease PerM
MSFYYRLLMSSSLIKQTQIASWVLAGLALVAVLHLHLLPSLLAGLLVYQLVHLLAPRLQRHFASERTQLVALFLLASLVVGAITAAVIATIAFFKGDSGNMALLFGKMAQILEDARTSMPSWVIDLLPENETGLRETSIEWLRDHATELRSLGKEAGITLAHILIGLIIGAMISLQQACDAAPQGPLAKALIERASNFADAFRRIVFAQVRISALNTLLTAIYLAIVLPMLGNLISNTVIVVVSLAHSPHTALLSLAFLVIVHKLEYFLNARIVGGQINAKAWELLIAMLLMEALFGLPGVVAAPIVYAWLKRELDNAGLL